MIVHSKRIPRQAGTNAIEMTIYPYSFRPEEKRAIAGGRPFRSNEFHQFFASHSTELKSARVQRYGILMLDDCIETAFHKLNNKRNASHVAIQ